MAPASTPTSVVLTDNSNPADVVDALFLGPFLAGDQPVARSRTVDHVKPDALLRPADGAEVRRAVTPSRLVTLTAGPGWMLHRSCWHEGTTYLSVTATSAEEAVRVLDEACLDATEPPTDRDDVAGIGFWNFGRGGGERNGRQIAVRPWADIASNYSGPVADALGRLMGLRAADIGARLLLMHGPPGTGKTTVVRALAHAWRDWCDLEYILDPEQLLHLPGYLMDVATGAEDGRWRLLVLEDCDELIRGDAKAGAGQSLARLLNLTDGILGQGLQVLVAITTNEPLARLHPAIVRPGRCLAQLELGRLTPAECRRWLGGPVLVPAEGLTLAELLARTSGAATIEAVDGPVLVGGYL